MNLNIRGKNVEITKAIREYMEEKMAKLNRYFENHEEITAYILVKIRVKEQVIEVTIPTKNFTLRAEEAHKDLYAAVDLVLDKLERQIRKNKTRLNRYKYEHSINLNFDDENIPEEEISKIIKRKNVEGKPMNEEEALLQMELLNHDFFIFKNIDEDCVSVLYLRKDGHYGVLNIK